MADINIVIGSLLQAPTPANINEVKKQIEKNIGNLNLNTKGINNVNSAMKNLTNSTKGFGTELFSSAKKFSEWLIIGNVIVGTMRAFKQGVSYINELDNALNEVRIVTNKSQDEVNALAKSYNNLAKEMSVTTKEIASTSADLYRQGLDDSQVQERMKGIIEYAKISSISLEDSNRIITATSNATGESVQKIIDIFALLGDSTSSDASEIGEALQRVASAAENSNLSLEKSASWIATISSVTRESASTIGRSLDFGAIAA